MTVKQLLGWVDKGIAKLFGFSASDFRVRKYRTAFVSSLVTFLATSLFWYLVG